MGLVLYCDAHLTPSPVGEFTALPVRDVAGQYLLPDGVEVFGEYAPDDYGRWHREPFTDRTRRPVRRGGEQWLDDDGDEIRGVPYWSENPVHRERDLDFAAHEAERVASTRIQWNPRRHFDVNCPAPSCRASLKVDGALFDKMMDAIAAQGLSAISVSRMRVLAGGSTPHRR